MAPNDEKLLIHVSNFRPVKRIRDCIHTLARMKASSNLPVRLVMCGDGPERAAAETLAHEYGLTNEVIFVGQVPNIADYLSVADLLLVPSETESFGLAALEAMACEVPVIATRAGGLPEVVKNGENGYLIRLGDINAMAEHAIEILSDEPKQRAMGRRGREWAVEQFNTEKVIPQYEQLYASIAGRPASRKMNPC